IGESLLELTELRVVEAAGLLLAVARDERHGGALAEQLDRRRHLRDADIQFVGDAVIDLVHGRLCCLIDAPLHCRFSLAAKAGQIQAAMLPRRALMMASASLTMRSTSSLQLGMS